MEAMLGCLFILIFGFIFFIIGIVSAVLRLFFGSGVRLRRQQSYGRQGSSSAYSESRTETQSGDAHHAGNRKNSRQRRSGKIFARDEGEYVDFEEV